MVNYCKTRAACGAAFWNWYFGQEHEKLLRQLQQLRCRNGGTGHHRSRRMILSCVQRMSANWATLWGSPAWSAPCWAAGTSGCCSWGWTRLLGCCASLKGRPRAMAESLGYPRGNRPGPRRRQPDAEGPGVLFRARPFHAPAQGRASAPVSSPRRRGRARICWPCSSVCAGKLPCRKRPRLHHFLQCNPEDMARKGPDDSGCLRQRSTAWAASRSKRFRRGLCGRHRRLSPGARRVNRCLERPKQHCKAGKSRSAVLFFRLFCMSAVSLFTAYSFFLQTDFRFPYKINFDN